MFNRIKEDELEALLSCLNAKLVKYDKNITIFEEGKVLHSFGVVLSGKLQTVQYDFSGNRSVLNLLEPFQIFGEAFSYVGTNFPLNVETIEKSEVLIMNSTKISNPCENGCKFHKQLINNLLHILAHKNVNLTQKIECMAKRTTREKLLTFLSIEAVKNNSKEFEISYDRQGLADYLGVERSAMSAELSKLRLEGILDSKKNKFGQHIFQFLTPHSSLLILNMSSAL